MEDNQQQVKFNVSMSQNNKNKQKNIKIKIFSNDFIKIKKKILKELRIYQKFIDEINIFLLVDDQEIQVQYIEDFYFFINHNLQSNPLQPLRIILSSDSQVLDYKPHRNAKYNKRNMKFDEQGQLINSQMAEEFEVNKPSDSLYTDDQEIKCAFCRVSSKDKATIKEVGPFYGPFNLKNSSKQIKKQYVHLLCAIWTPNVYLDSQSKMKNIQQEIVRSNRLACSYCGILGAGLGCIDNCKNTYHYLCANQENAGCDLDFQNFVMHCQIHNQNVFQDEEYICQICNIDQEDDEMIILCDKCDKGYHIYCLPDKLTSIPENEWFCSKCI